MYNIRFRRGKSIYAENGGLDSGWRWQYYDSNSSGGQVEQVFRGVSSTTGEGMPLDTL